MEDQPRKRTTFSLLSRKLILYSAITLGCAILLVSVLANTAILNSHHFAFFQRLIGTGKPSTSISSFTPSNTIRLTGMASTPESVSASASASTSAELTSMKTPVYFLSHGGVGRCYIHTATSTFNAY